MAELSLVFGPQRHLAGTLTLPPEGQAARIGVVLLNAGVIHRIGPHRFNVKLARALASQGAAVLRMDLSGQGDSGVHPQALPFQEQAIADLRAAMDHLQRICSVDRFVIAGICSGAFNGLATALVDARVAGLWMLDGYAYPTAKTDLVRAQKQFSDAPLRTLGSWTRSALRRVGSAIKPPAGSEAAPAVVDYGHRTPPRDTFARDIQALVDRGTEVCFVYTGSMLWRYNYAEQLREAFSGCAFIDQVRCEYLPGIDHTATTLAAQRVLIGQISEWLPRVLRQPQAVQAHA